MNELMLYKLAYNGALFKWVKYRKYADKYREQKAWEELQYISCKITELEIRKERCKK